MCLIIEKQKKAKIARRNFVVSKYLYPYDKTEAISSFRRFIYQLGKEYCVNAAFVTHKSEFKAGNSIKIGLHSCIKNKRKPGVRGVEYYAIIPKGASYIIGRDNDIVSNRLIVKKRMKKVKNRK